MLSDAVVFKPFHHFSYRKAAEMRRTQKPPNTLFDVAPKPTTAAVRETAAQRLTQQHIQENMVSYKYTIQFLKIENHLWERVHRNRIIYCLTLFSEASLDP